MQILITGASGFVGAEIVKELSKQKENELYLIRSQKSDRETVFLPNIARIYQVDVGNKQTLEQLLKIGKVDLVIHAAGLAHQFGSPKRDDFWRTNVLGTENICNLAVKLGVKHFILISSVAVYGNYEDQEVFEDFECRPIGDYAESKWFAEQKASEICADKKIMLTILRLGTVIGENDPGNMSRLITAIDKNRFFWIGKGENKKSLIYKSDVAETISEIIDLKEFSGGIFNLTATPVLMREIVETIFRGLGKKPTNLFLPETLFRNLLKINKAGYVKFLGKLERTLKKWLSNEIYSEKKLQEKYGLKPRTDIFEALEKQVFFYKKTKKQ